MNSCIHHSIFFKWMCGQERKPLIKLPEIPEDLKEVSKKCDEYQDKDEATQQMLKAPHQHHFFYMIVIAIPINTKHCMVHGTCSRDLFRRKSAQVLYRRVNILYQLIVHVRTGIYVFKRFNNDDETCTTCYLQATSRHKLLSSKCRRSKIWRLKILTEHLLMNWRRMRTLGQGEEARRGRAKAKVEEKRRPRQKEKQKLKQSHQPHQNLMSPMMRKARIELAKERWGKWNADWTTSRMPNRNTYQAQSPFPKPDNTRGENGSGSQELVHEPPSQEGKS